MGKGIYFSKLKTEFTYMKKKVLLIAGLLSAVALVKGQSIPNKIDPGPFHDNAGHWYGIADAHNMINPLPTQQRYLPNQLKQIADNMLLFQKLDGGWPKNYDMFAVLSDEQRSQVMSHKKDVNTTFDNGSTYTQIRALAIAYANLKDPQYMKGVVRGLEFVLKAQYANGGWPQYFPLEKKYSKEITYNDGAMMGVVQLLSDIVVLKDPLYDFLDAKLRNRLEASYNKGVDCILNTQIKDNGVLTAWCQQHDEKTLAPAWARAYEPPSICNSESVGIVEFLMGIDHPSQRVITAVQSAISWFEKSKIMNTRVEKVKADAEKTPFRVSKSDRVVVIDSEAPPIWTRFYELNTDRPLFCNRDSKLVYSLAEVARERRDGYGWYTYAPQRVLDSYAKWQQKWVPGHNVLK